MALRADAPNSEALRFKLGDNWRTNSETNHLLHLVWMFIVGIIVGALARWIFPGAEHMGIFMTGILGIVGSYVGGFITRLFSQPAEGAVFHPAGIIMSVIGAVIVLFLASKVGS